MSVKHSTVSIFSFPFNLFTSSTSHHSSYFLPRTTNRRWSLFRSWLSGKWHTRRKPCFSSVPPPMSQKCTKSTPPPRRSETAGWHTFDKLLRGTRFQPKTGENTHFIQILFHICGIALRGKKAIHINSTVCVTHKVIPSVLFPHSCPHTEERLFSEEEEEARAFRFKEFQGNWNDVILWESRNSWPQGGAHVLCKRC